jgi:beta-galactosidase
MKERIEKGISLLLAMCMALSCFAVGPAAMAAGPGHGQALYVNPFDEGTTLEDWAITGDGTYSIADGVLHGVDKKAGTLLTRDLSAQSYVLEADVTIKSDKQDPKGNGASVGIVFGYESDKNFYHLRVDNSGKAQLLQWVNGTATKIHEPPFPWTVDKTYIFAVEVADGAINCYVDGTKVFTHVDASGAVAGGIGFRVFNCAADFDDLRVSMLAEKEPEEPEEPVTPGELPFYEDFDDGDLAGWKQVNASGTGGSYYALVQDGAGGWYLRGATTSGALAVTDAVSAANGIVSASLLFPEKKGSGGILFRYQDHGNFYHFRLSDSSSGQAHLYKWTNGSSALLATKGYSWAANKTYVLKVEADGPQLNCYVNDELIFSYRDEAPLLAAGTIGFRMHNTENARMDNLSMVALPEPEVTLTAPTRDAALTELPVVISGMAANAVRARLSLDGGAAQDLTLAGDGNFTQKIYPSNGTHTVTVIAYRADESMFAEESVEFTVNAEVTLTARLVRSANVALGDPIQIIFSQPVEETSLTGEIRLLDGEEPVPAAAAVDPRDASSCTVILTPDAPLESGTGYQVEIGVGVRDVLGNTPATPILLAFTTARDLADLPPLEEEGGQTILSLNGDWSFMTDPHQTGVSQGWQNLTDTAGWDTLPVPGNWDSENEYANYKGAAWYGRTFTVPAAYDGYPVYLELDSVYYDCTVWINGQMVGSHGGGYTTFEFRVDRYLDFGSENTIAILTDNDSYNYGEWGMGAWWKWGGISGHAALRIHNVSKFDWQHITPKPKLEDGTAKLSFEYKINNLTGTDKAYTVVSRVYDKAAGVLVGEVETPVTAKPTGSGENTNQRFTAELDLTADKVKLWHFDSPNLYTVRTWLYEDEESIHYVEDDIGIRKVEFRKDSDGAARFYLNGEALRMVGANRVGDDRVNGHTEPDYVIMRDMDYMKSMGMNFARVSHIPMTKNILDYCDEIGFLLVCEGNTWGDPPEPDPEIGYTAVRWYTEMIERDYNHPSIIAWSLGNELHGNTQATKDYAAFMHKYIPEKLDASRAVTEVSNTGTNTSDSLTLCPEFIAMNAYGNGRGRAQDGINANPGKPLFMAEYGNSQTSEDPDKGDLAAQSLLNQYSPLPSVFAAAIWTLNDYRSHLFGTPVSQNRPWGATTVWGTKKIGFNSLRKASSPVKELSVRQVGESMLLQLQIKDITADLPAYPLRDAQLKWEVRNDAGQVIKAGLVPIPDMAADGGTFGATAVLAGIPQGTAAAFRVTVVDSLGYEVAETFHYFKAPPAPVITEVVPASDSLRVVFEGAEGATEYTVTVSDGTTTKSAAVKLNRHADFTGLTAGAEYTATVTAKNSAGSTPSASRTVTMGGDGGLAPVIWHTEPVANGFFIGCAVKNETDTYEVRYSTQSGNLSQSLTARTIGGLKVSGLIGGQTYYYQLRSISAGGAASAWSQEITVTPETEGQTLPAPVVRGGAPGVDAVSLTIDPSWKSTGYTVRYGMNPDSITEERYFHHAEVSQLMIPGLAAEETYYFSVAAHNNDGTRGEFSEPVLVTLSQEDAGDQIVVTVMDQLAECFDYDQPRQCAIGLYAYNGAQEDVTLTITAPNLPEGICLDGELTFTVPAMGSVEHTVVIALSETVRPGTYLIPLVVKQGEDTILESEVAVRLVETATRIRDDFTEDPIEKFTVRVAGGKLAHVAGKLLVTPDTATSAPLITIGEPTMTDYILDSDIALRGDSPSGGISAGLVFRYQDEGNYYHFRLDRQNGATTPTLQVLSWINGTSTRHCAIPLSSGWTDMVHLRVVVRGNSADFYADGVLMERLPVELPAGSVGYRAYGAKVEFDNLHVAELISPTVDKSELQALVDRCGDYHEEDYTAESWAPFAAARAEAERVLADDFASAEDVSVALETLSNVADALVVKPELPQEDAPSTPSTTTRTIKNEDGSVTKIVTNRVTGTVTETTTYPDGKIVKTVTEKNGDMSRTVSGPDGRQLAAVSIPGQIPAPERSFADVPAGHWASEEVGFVTGLGLFDGTGGDKFSDTAPMTRGMLVTVLHRLSGRLPGGEKTFADVDSGAWYAQAVTWAASSGVISGVSDKRFAPENNVTREEIAVMLYNYAVLLGLDTKPTEDTRLEGETVSPWAADAMAWAVEKGLLNGRTGGGLEPQGIATRAEVAAIFMRMIKTELS